MVVFAISYNVKVIKYSTGYQVRLYSTVVGLNNYVPVDDALCLDYLDSHGKVHEVCLGSETGRISTEEIYYKNPFTDDLVKFRSDAQIEHSQRVSRNRAISSLYYDARSNNWDWFITFTFNGQKVDRYNYDACVKKMHNWLFTCKRHCPDMRYIVVPELHKDGAYHFHGLFADCDALGFVDSGCKDKKSGRNIYTVGRYRLGFTTATKVTCPGNVCGYITKYITKELCAVTFGRKRYWKSRNLKQAEVMELTLDGISKAAFFDSLKPYVQHHSFCSFDFMSVDYLELDSGVDIDFSVGGEV